MGHIELTECKSLQNKKLADSRKESEEFYANYENVRAYHDYGRTAGDFGVNAPQPFLSRAPAANTVDNEGSAGGTRDGDVDDSAVDYEEFLATAQGTQGMT